MKIVFIVLILLGMDIVIFSVTYGVTKRYSGAAYYIR